MGPFVSCHVLMLGRSKAVTIRHVELIQYQQYYITHFRAIAQITPMSICLLTARTLTTTESSIKSTLNSSSESKGSGVISDLAKLYNGLTLSFFGCKTSLIFFN